MKNLRFFPVYVAFSPLFVLQIANPALSAPTFGDDEIISMSPANSSVFIDLKEKNKIDLKFNKQTSGNLLSDFKDKRKNT